MYLLRDNGTSATYPDGIFTHIQMYHIKQENIGLIEVMGLAILPARSQTATGNCELLGRRPTVKSQLHRATDWRLPAVKRNSYTKNVMTVIRRCGWQYLFECWLMRVCINTIRLAVKA